MRLNVYAEEITDRIEIVEKTTADGTFTGLRIYLAAGDNACLSILRGARNSGGHGHGSHNDEHDYQPRNIGGPFMHRPGDDDSSAVTFWGKRDLRKVLAKALAMLDKHYAERSAIANVVVSVDGPAACAGCGQPGFIQSSPPYKPLPEPYNVVLRWMIQGEYVCLVCFDRNMRIKREGERP